MKFGYQKCKMTTLEWSNLSALREQRSTFDTSTFNHLQMEEYLVFQKIKRPQFANAEV